ncbi:putative transposase domain protein [Burkholderia pseudomallei ABCPW 107]|nr:putative transposase domain protein [Burkholderia pseudomallei MSHR7504]KGS37568.1 putative transposase domain protein [Burkholderia pseudomallei ABCPW 107]
MPRPASGPPGSNGPFPVVQIDVFAMEHRAWQTDSYAFKWTSSYLMLRQVRSTNTLSRQAPLPPTDNRSCRPSTASVNAPAVN